MAWPTASEMWESTGWWSLLGVCPSPSLLAASELQSLDCRVQTVLEKGVWNAKSVLHVSMKLHNNSLRTSLRTVSLMSFLNCKFVLTAPRCNENIILSNKIGVCSCYENITLSVLRKHYLMLSKYYFVKADRSLFMLWKHYFVKADRSLLSCDTHTVLQLDGVL